MGALQEFKENPVKYFKSILTDIVVIFVSIAYILYKMVDLEKTELNPLILVAEAIMGIICGVVIKQALGEKGFNKGYESELWQNEEKKYNDACNEAVEYMDRVDEFYLVREKEKKSQYRRNHLQAYRMKYQDWFNADGDYIGNKDMYNKLDWRQKIVLKKCIRVHIYVLNLFSEYSTASEQDTKPEMTDKRQRQRNFGKNTTSAIIVAVIGVYFIPILTNWNWASLIAATMQVALWIVFGVLQLFTNFNFVVQDKVDILKTKKEDICRFISDCQHGYYARYKDEVKVELQPIVVEDLIEEVDNHKEDKL